MPAGRETRSGPSSPGRRPRSRKLAEIAAFPLYVTTTPDDMLEVALRNAHRPARSLTYREMPDIDLPDDVRTAAVPTVVHVFGSISESFALT